MQSSSSNNNKNTLCNLKRNQTDNPKTKSGDISHSSTSVFPKGAKPPTGKNRKNPRKAVESVCTTEEAIPISLLNASIFKQ